MVRVGFVIEATGATMGCLLNPLSLVVQRSAGVRPEEAPSGLFARTTASDYPLLYTGGGTTELLLELLFDAPLHTSMRAQDAGTPGAAAAEIDVRDLTSPFFNLSENAGDRTQPPIARFIWGKAWNVRGVVASVSERLERFTDGGVPHRSWLSMRFLRLVDTPAARDAVLKPAPALDLSSAGRERARDHVISGTGETANTLTTSAGDRLDTLASRYYGNPSLWRAIASYNNIDDPARIPPGTTLRIPPPAAP
jgi:nucleoid-associated protein YgaU